MFTREKKLIALLLTAALAFTMNTSLFAAVGAETNVAEAAVELTSGGQTTPDQTSPSQFSADYTVSEAAAVSNNKTARPVSIDRVGGVDGLSISFDQLVPFFGKKIGKDSSGKVLGDITISYKGTKIAYKTAKVVYLKKLEQKGGAFPTVSNATIQIKIDTKDLKAKVSNKDDQKKIKKAFGNKEVKGSRNALGAAKIIVYPYRLNTPGDEKTASIKGKKSKIEKAQLTLNWAGKTYKVKSGKDLFGKDKEKKSFKFNDKKDGIIVSTNEVWSGIPGTSENAVPLKKLDSNKLKD